MLLNIDKWPGEAVAAIDAQGNQLTYGELRDFAKQVAEAMPARSLLFLLVENNVGGIAWTIGNICAGNVPLILHKRQCQNSAQNSPMLPVHSGSKSVSLQVRQCAYDHPSP